MKHISRLLLVAAFITFASATESEPEPENHDILLKALQSIQSSKEHSSHFSPEEKTAIYYRSIKHIGRVKTADGIRHLFILHRIRSGNLETQAETPPPRGSWLLAVFDPEIRLITIRNTEEDTRVEGTRLFIGDSLVCDLSNHEELAQAFGIPSAREE